MTLGNRVEVWQGDITTLDVDAIVNAANEALMGGGGADGAIHRAAGPELIMECRRAGRCPTGEARITKGCLLKARHVIHAVGPVYRDGTSGEPALLASAYRKSLELAQRHKLHTIAFPGLSTGVYGYPLAEASVIAVRTVMEFLAFSSSPAKVIFCTFDEAATRAMREALAR